MLVEDNKFLKPDYDPNEIYIEATTVNRTLSSARALMSGMYPPGKGPVFESTDNYKRSGSVPPYYVGGKNHIVKELSVVPYGPNFIPIHMSSTFKSSMLLGGYD